MNKLGIFLLLGIFSASGFANSTLVRPPEITVNQGVSHPKVAPFTGMAEAQTFVDNIDNHCGQTNNSDFCFVQLNVTGVGASTTTGTNSCPEKYGALMSFGTGVKIINTNTVLYYFLHHEIIPVPNTDVENFYKSKNYVCGPKIDPANYHTSFTETTPPDLNFNSLVLTLIGRPSHVFDNYGKIQYYWLIEGGSRGTNPDGTTNFYQITIHGYDMRCERSAGFYNANPIAPAYPLATPGHEFSPTITICGKLTRSWNEKPITPP